MNNRKAPVGATLTHPRLWTRQERPAGTCFDSLFILVDTPPVFDLFTFAVAFRFK